MSNFFNGILKRRGRERSKERQRERERERERERRERKSKTRINRIFIVKKRDVRTF